MLPWLLDEFLSAPLRAVESSRRRNVWKRTVRSGAFRLRSGGQGPRRRDRETAISFNRWVERFSIERLGEKASSAGRARDITPEVVLTIYQRFSHDEHRQLSGSRAAAQLPQQVLGVRIRQVTRRDNHAWHFISRDLKAAKAIRRRQNLDAKFLEPAFQELSGGADRNR